MASRNFVRNSYLAIIIIFVMSVAAACTDVKLDAPAGTPVDRPARVTPQPVVSNRKNSLAISEPLPNATIGEKVTVKGEGIAYEGTIFVEVVVGSRVLGRALVTTEAEPNEVAYFTTDVVVTPLGSETEGQVVIYTTSPKDGAVDQYAAVPVKIRSSGGGSPTSVADPQPSIRINPTRGRAGTEVTIVGAGFPAGGEVQVRIGSLNSGADPYVYASTEAGQHGNIQVSFVVPKEWQNGEPITLPELLVLASTPDYAIKATAQFAYDTLGTPSP